MQSAYKELVIVLAVMAVLFIFGLAAVVIFWRVWLREKKATQDETSVKRNNPT